MDKVWAYWRIPTEILVSNSTLRGRRRRWDRKQKRGGRGGLKAKLRANPWRTPLPSLLLANVRLLENKMDHLQLKLTTSVEVTNCCALTLVETWLTPLIPDAAVSLDGLTTFCLDRDWELTGKTRGGGTCKYINNNWCNNTKIMAKHCSA